MMHYQPLVESRMAKASPEVRKFYEDLRWKKQLVFWVAALFTFITFALPWDGFAQSVSVSILTPLWWTSAIVMALSWFIRLMMSCLASYPGEY